MPLGLPSVSTLGRCLIRRTKGSFIRLELKARVAYLGAIGRSYDHWIFADRPK